MYESRGSNSNPSGQIIPRVYHRWDNTLFCESVLILASAVAYLPNDYKYDLFYKRRWISVSEFALNEYNSCLILVRHNTNSSTPNSCKFTANNYASNIRNSVFHPEAIENIKSNARCRFLKKKWSENLLSGTDREIILWKRNLIAFLKGRRNFCIVVKNSVAKTNFDRN